MQSFRQIGLKLWKIGAIQNRYPIVVYGVMSDRESKNPRPLPLLTVFVKKGLICSAETGTNIKNLIIETISKVFLCVDFVVLRRNMKIGTALVSIHSACSF